MRTELKIIHALRMIESNEGGLKIKLYKYTHSSDFPKRIFETHVIMAIGVVCILGATGYIAYMRSKYEGMGYYSAVQSDGTEVFTKKQSKWD
uniref:Small integral membrane protein 8 n=1 Tax=Phlebotomus papatasi TaxID=29031 RepID=A0A1B0DCV6_PHLPP